MINTTKKAIEFETPSLPNFIRAKATDEDVHNRTTIGVGDFTDEELKEIGKEWTEALLAHAKFLRARKKH